MPSGTLVTWFLRQMDHCKLVRGSHVSCRSHNGKSDHQVCRKMACFGPKTGQFWSILAVFSGILGPVGPASGLNCFWHTCYMVSQANGPLQTGYRVTRELQVAKWKNQERSASRSLPVRRTVFNENAPNR